jgi:hypothetical protein
MRPPFCKKEIPQRNHRGTTTLWRPFHEEASRPPPPCLHQQYIQHPGTKSAHATVNTSGEKISKFRPSLKNAKRPKQRISFQCAALKIFDDALIVAFALLTISRACSALRVIYTFLSVFG